ncbi:ATP-binding protein (AAA domain) [Arcobacter venerupis]|uniref:ATP-binding protein (AAA domain) n=1 Tax=Arcobacter venerupis TaxID=1054033 RepID=A0AAE7B7U8_9BACT|nr:ATP-binding protein [Arcobacter venerupis]QKF66691.1 ATP-binding protein (AAA domain) [Arcobacter venerupis]RWS49578.1 cell division protein [Arcobacter venerupis]
MSEILSNKEETLEDNLKETFLFEKDLNITFDEVAGLDTLKKKANMKIIMPFQKPELFKKYNKKIGGGILMYGPPGCGKTHFAKAIAGECKASFFHVGIDQILDKWLGNSEKNIAGLFKEARAHKPAIIFIDEIDALGRKRELLKHSSSSSVINTFLSQLDGFDSDNEGILIIGATNAPWDVDSAFKRTGRFDTLFFVPPPDDNARESMFKLLLKDIPIYKIDYKKLASETNFYSGADIKGIVDSAIEIALDEILETGNERDIVTEDILASIATNKPTVTEWFDLVNNVLEYANESGEYNDVAEYLAFNKPKKKKIMGFL